MCLAPDGRTLASTGMISARSLGLGLRLRLALLGGNSGSDPPHELVVLDTATGRLLLRTEDEAQPRFSPDGRRLATLHQDGAVRLRDLPAASEAQGAYSRSP